MPLFLQVRIQQYFCTQYINLCVCSGKKLIQIDKSAVRWYNFRNSAAKAVSLIYKTASPFYVIKVCSLSDILYMIKGFFSKKCKF